VYVSKIDDEEFVSVCIQTSNSSKKMIGLVVFFLLSMETTTKEKDESPRNKFFVNLYMHVVLKLN